MKNERNHYGLPDMHYPTPEEIERAIEAGRRVWARAVRDIPRVIARGLARASGGQPEREIRTAPESMVPR